MDIPNHKEEIAEKASFFSFNQQEEPFDDYLIHFTSQQKHVSLNGIDIEIQHGADWFFSSKNESFSVRIFLIGEKILLARMKGKMTFADATAAYQLIRKVLEETKLTSYYYIEDISKLLPVARQTRSIIKKLDNTLEPARIRTYLIFPQIDRTMYTMFNTTYRKNVNSSHSMKEAILACINEPPANTLDKNPADLSTTSFTDLHNASKEDLLETIAQLREENTTLKSYHQHRISCLAGMLGQSLWGDSLDFQKLKLSPEDDFFELYEAFSILLKDFQYLQAKKNIARANSKHLPPLIPALDSTSAMLLVLDPQLRLLNYNASFKNYIKTQFSKEIDAGQQLFQIFPENTHTKWKNLLKDVSRGRSIQISDNGYFDSERRVFSITANPVCNEKNEVTSIVLFAVATDHKDAYLYEQIRLLSEHTSDLVCSLTPNGLVTYVTPSIALILGYSQDEFIGKSIFRYIHPDDTSQFLSSGYANFFLRDSAFVEFRLLKNDQSYVWLESASTPIKSEKGEVQHIVVSARKHMEKKQLSVQLSIREEELKSTLEGMSESVYVFDKNGVLVTTNQQKNKDYFIERSCDALIGKAYQEIFADTFIQKLDKAIRVACTTHVKHEFEYIVKRTGEENAPDHYKICVLARKDISGNFAGITMITRNVTASKRLKEQNAALEKANEELDHFVYSASHDLRAPLASTMGLINITRISDDLQEKTNYLNLMETSLQKMDRYIHDITDYSRNARLAIELEKIEFDELTNDIIQTLSYHENTSKIDFLVKTEDTNPFYSDYSRLNIIFRNVISNAVKYHDLTRPHPYLSIDIKITAQEGIFRFEDNGIGIEEKYIDKIFDMFYQASPESFGSGLGLYIVKEAMNKLKGSIKVESTPGQGSIFTITIPNHTEKLP